MPRIIMGISSKINLVASSLFILTHSSGLIDHSSFIKEQRPQGIVGDRHYLATHIPKDVKLTGQS